MPESDLEAGEEGSLFNGVPRYRRGEPFIPCFRCGVCCSRYLIRITMTDVRRISDGLSLDWQRFIEEYTDRSQPEDGTFVLRRCPERCVFLKYDEASRQELCSIHDFKPSTCRDWVSSLYRRECREGMNTCWNLSVDEEGHPIGTDEQLATFYSCLDSISACDATSDIER